MKMGIIIQARVGSTRLPNKVLLPLPRISNDTVLHWVVDRCCQVPMLMFQGGGWGDDAPQVLSRLSGFTVIVATTTLKEDDAIVDSMSERLTKATTVSNDSPAFQSGVAVFRGDSEDVLSRYYHGAKEHNLDIVIRVTSDCPFIDPSLIAEGAKQFYNTYDDLDYMSNNLVREYPHGLDFEIMTFEALERAHNNGAHHQREHVTTYIRESEQFRKKQVDKTDGVAKILQKIETQGQVDPSNIRVTIDNHDDYLLLLRCISTLNKMDSITSTNTNTPKHKHRWLGSNIHLESLVNLFNQQPHLQLINQNNEKRSVRNRNG